MTLKHLLSQMRNCIPGERKGPPRPSWQQGSGVGTGPRLWARVPGHSTWVPCAANLPSGCRGASLKIRRKPIMGFNSYLKKKKEKSSNQLQMIHKVKPRRCPSSSTLSASGEPLRWRCPRSRTRAAEGAHTHDGSLWLQDEEGRPACPWSPPSKDAAGSLPLPPPGNWTDWAVRSDRAHAHCRPAHRDVGSPLAHGPWRPRSSADTRHPAALISGPLITASRRWGLG